MFNNDYLLRQIKLKGSLGEGRYEDFEILEVAYDQLISICMPSIISNREEHFVRVETIDLIVGKNNYPIPDRAYGLDLRHVKIIQNGTKHPIQRLDLQDVNSNSSAKGFYIMGSEIILSNIVSEGLQLELSYFQTPSMLVMMERVAKINSISEGELSIVSPTNFTANDLYDIVSFRNGYSTKYINLQPLSLTNDSITFASVGNLEVGDYVCLAKESPFAMLPDGCQPWLIQLAVAEMLESNGSGNEAAIARGKAAMLEEKLRPTLSSRVQGSPRRLRSGLI